MVATFYRFLLVGCHIHGVGAGITRSGVRVRTGIGAAGPQAEPAEVDLPPLAMVTALAVIGQVVMPQDDTGAAVLGLQGDDDPGRPGRDGGIVGPAPGEDQAVRRVDLEELADRL